MKKLFTCFFLVAIYASVGAADEAATISRVIPSSKTIAQTVEASGPSATASRTAVTRTAVARVPLVDVTTKEILEETHPLNVPANTTAAPARTAAASRTVNLNQNQTGGSGRNSGTPVRSGISRATVAGDVTASGRSTLENTVRTVGRNARTEAASINNSAAVRRAGITLRPSTAEVGGRATIAGTDVQTGSNIDYNEGRAVQSRAAVASIKTAATTKETITEATERLQQTSDLNKSCQQQYNDCMDQFCAVIDANQKRCTCSANLSKYTKVEAAVKEANTQLNEVAQRIRYVGLSADEIRAIMSATEAELELSGTRDNTESRNMLEEIEKLIKNPTSATTYSADTYSGLDMDMDFTADADNLFTLDFLGTNTSSFSNLRGRDLYNAATKRCNSILTQCKSAGATAQQITGNYDLAIDKDCIAYEQGLTKMNDSLKNNVRSANNMLQKARLAVLQNKNQYDAKGCIAALNTCMMDEMVCGADYTKCLDPTKNYIDENGNVVLGQRISDITAFMTAYDNSKIDKAFLASAKAANLSECATDGTNGGQCIVRYLLEKIGTGDTVSDGGLCRAVLDKCQRVSYDTNSKYIPYNDVVVNYIQRAMVNIHSAQKQIISDYASSCMVDIANCYNQQVSQVNAWSSTASVSSVYNVMRGACRNVSLTCAYAVFTYDTAACPTTGNVTDCGDTEACRQDVCINSASIMFYQSLLCTENSSYADTPGTAGTNGYVNELCKCDTGYAVFGKTCTRACSVGTYRETLTGVCTSCKAGQYGVAGSAGTDATCDTCPVGTYSDNTGATSCTACESGKTSPAGSTSANACIATP
ncbi:MAG: hypothetical protein LBF37_00150 [Rickettsiales bacterium]|jgi:hypothetical protein|nr:hypothetical protein [Rickettsiales bacterium]